MPEKVDDYWILKRFRRSNKKQGGVIFKAISVYRVRSLLSSKGGITANVFPSK